MVFRHMADRTVTIERTRPTHTKLLGRAFAALHGDVALERLNHWYGGASVERLMLGIFYQPEAWERSARAMARRAEAQKARAVTVPSELHADVLRLQRAVRETIRKEARRTVSRALQALRFPYVETMLEDAARERRNGLSIASAVAEVEATYREARAYAESWIPYARQRLDMATLGTLNWNHASKNDLGALYFICTGEKLPWKKV